MARGVVQVSQLEHRIGFEAEKSHVDAFWRGRMPD